MSDTNTDHSVQNTGTIDHTVIARVEGGRVPLPLPGNAMTGSSQNLPVIAIRHSPLNPRRDFDEDSISDLANNIRLLGLQTPIRVRPVVDASLNNIGETVYEIIAGERRYRAIRLLGEEFIPCIVTPASDTESMEIALAENLMRENLNPMDEARGYDKFQEFGWTQERIAARIGRKQADIAKRLMLLKLPDSVQVAVAGGKLSATHGVILAGIASEYPAEAERQGSAAAQYAMTTAELQQRVTAFKTEQDKLKRDEDDAQQPRLLDTEEPKSAPVPVTTTEAAPASVPMSEEYTGDVYIPETTPEPTPELDQSLREGREAAARFAATIDDSPVAVDLPKETPAEVFAPTASSQPTAKSVPTHSADDIITPFAYLLLSALRDKWNAEHPDKEMTMQERLETILSVRAEQSGIDVESIETAAANA